MVKLRGEDIRATSIPVASIEVQRWIVKAADSARARHTQLVARLRWQIDLLQEHRQALITAAVTGELSIPGVAA